MTIFSTTDNSLLVLKQTPFYNFLLKKLFIWIIYPVVPFFMSDMKYFSRAKVRWNRDTRHKLPPLKCQSYFKQNIPDKFVRLVREIRSVKWDKSCLNLFKIIYFDLYKFSGKQNMPKLAY